MDSATESKKASNLPGNNTQPAAPDPIDVFPTAAAIRKMAEVLRDAALQLDNIADATLANEDFTRVGDALLCVSNIMPNLRLDLLVVRPLRQMSKI